MSQRISPLDWPRLTRFYGISPAELYRTPNVLLQVYLDALPVLQAEETMVAFLTADLPYMKDADRKKAKRLLSRWLPDEPEQKIDPDTDAGVATAARLGIGIKIDRG